MQAQLFQDIDRAGDDKGQGRHRDQQLTAIIVLARRVSGIVSVGEKATALVRLSRGSPGLGLPVLGCQGGPVGLGEQEVGVGSFRWRSSTPARANSPPRSNSQYQIPNTMTLVKNSAAPFTSSTAALLLTCPVMMR